MFSRVRLLLTISIGLLVLAACGEPVPPETGFDLSVTVVGDGNVTSDPAGIDTATGSASATFADGEVVTLTAAPTGVATFTGWTGGPCDGSADAECEVEMTADTAVTANFTADEEPGDDVTFTVNVNNGGAAVGNVAIDVDGTVTDCTDSCEVTAPENSTVELTATASPGGFAGWTGGDCDGIASATCTVTVNELEEDVTANFNDVATVSETVSLTEAVEELISGGNQPVNFPPGHNYQGSSDLDFGYDTTHETQQWIGMRFDFAEVPAGANIQSAVIDMTANAASSDEVSITLIGEAVVAPEPFADDANTTASQDTSTRAGAEGTTATVDWTITDAWASAAAVSTPNLASIVQEIVDLDGWNGAVVIFASPDEDGASTGTRPVATASVEMTINYVEMPAGPVSN